MLRNFRSMGKERVGNRQTVRPRAEKSHNGYTANRRELSFSVQGLTAPTRFLIVLWDSGLSRTFIKIHFN